MTGRDAGIERRVSEMRRAFDERFAEPVEERKRDFIDFLLVVVAGQPYAARFGELARLAVDRKIVAVPAAAPGLLGLCAIQGQLVPVFDLGVLLGAAPAERTPRWMALYRDPLVALAFEELRGTQRVASLDVRLLESAPAHAPLSHQAISVDSSLIYVLDIPSVVSRILKTGDRP
jgi:chemotaxis signal transduction protein